jgi:hypothetical protein
MILVSEKTDKANTYIAEGYRTHYLIHLDRKLSFPCHNMWGLTWKTLQFICYTENSQGSFNVAKSLEWKKKNIKHRCDPKIQQTGCTFNVWHKCRGKFYKPKQLKKFKWTWVKKSFLSTLQPSFPFQNLWLSVILSLFPLHTPNANSTARAQNVFCELPASLLFPFAHSQNKTSM